MQKKYVGPLTLLLCCIFYTGSFSLAKGLTSTVPVHTIMLFRFLAGPLYLIPFFIITKKKLKIESYGVFAVRILCGVSAMTCLFFAFKYGNIGKSMIIFQTATIWTLIYDYVKNNHRPHIYSLWAIPVAFIALVMIIQPQQINQIQIGDVLALAGAILNAGVYISLKQLRENHDTTTIVLVTYISSALIMLIPNSIAIPALDLKMLTGLLLMCTIGFIGNLLMTQGFKYTSAGISSLIMLSIIPLTTLSGMILFSESYNTVAWLGVILIVIALSIIARWK